MVENIKSLCASNNIAITTLEKACGLGTHSIYNWDRVSPSVKNLKKVADYFGVTIDALIAEKATA